MLSNPDPKDSSIANKRIRSLIVIAALSDVSNGERIFTMNELSASCGSWFLNRVVQIERSFCLDFVVF